MREVVENYLRTLRVRASPRAAIEAAAILDRILVDLKVVTAGEITRAAVKGWRELRRQSGASNKTINNQVGVLRAALACALEDELIPADPLNGMRSLPIGAKHQVRRPRALAEWEIARLLAALDDMDAHPPPEQLPRIPQAIVVRVLLETGARWGELTATTWADVDLAHGTIGLRAETTKTQRERCIPIRPETSAELAAYRLECARVLGAMPGSSDRVFLSPHGRPWTSGSNFRKILRVAYERAGILERDATGKLHSRDGHALHVHTLRHTCCTRLLAAGVPVPIVQAVLGHASPQMTLRVYAHLAAEQARSYLNALPALGASALPLSNPSIRSAEG